MKQVLKIRDDGQKEYAHDEGNVFANFERVANTLNIPREKVLLTYMLKHIDGIVAYVEGHKSQREPVDGRIIDAIVYLCLLYGMTKEDPNTVTYWESDST
tara:strand:- start:11 stop:310 length:300 start_codon:yes stop_codon:yes gene_type:complete